MAAAITNSVTLQLTGKEASALLLVLHHVAGSPESTPRGLLDKILNALENSGVEPVEWPVKIEGSICFQTPA